MFYYSVASGGANSTPHTQTHTHTHTLTHTHTTASGRARVRVRELLGFLWVQQQTEEDTLGEKNQFNARRIPV